MVIVMRTEWRNFPPIIRNGDSGDLQWISKAEKLKNPDYLAAKAGNYDAAIKLIQEKIKPGAIMDLNKLLEKEDKNQIELVSVVAKEANGNNKIPNAISVILSKKLGIPINQTIVQAEKVGRTGRGIDHRLAFIPTFQGKVNPDKRYIIIDDTVSVGGTLAALRGYIEKEGANVIAGFVMTGYEQALNLKPNEKILNKLFSKHEKEQTNEFCKTEFGFSASCLTQGEAGQIAAASSLDDIRRRIELAREDARRTGLQIENTRDNARERSRRIERIGDNIERIRKERSQSIDNGREAGADQRTQSIYPLGSKSGIESNNSRLKTYSAKS